MIDPFKWADEPCEDIEEYQKQFKEDAKKIIEEMNYGTFNKRCHPEQK
jgi:hypothetical protein